MKRFCLQSLALDRMIHSAKYTCVHVQGHAQRVLAQAIFVFDDDSEHFSEYYVNLIQKTETSPQLCKSQQFHAYVNGTSLITGTAARLVQQLSLINDEYFDDTMFDIAAILRNKMKTKRSLMAARQAAELLHSTVYTQFSLLHELRHSTQELQQLPIHYTASVSMYAQNVNCVRISLLHDLNDCTNCVAIDMFDIQTTISRNTNIYTDIEQAQNFVCNTWKAEKQIGNKTITYVNNDTNLSTAIAYSLSASFIVIIFLQSVYYVNKYTHIVSKIRSLYRSVKQCKDRYINLANTTTIKDDSL